MTTLNERTEVTPQRRAGKAPAYLSRLCRDDRLVYDSIPEDVDFVDNTVFRSPKAEERFFGPNAMAIHIPLWTSYAEEVTDVKPARSRKGNLSGAEEVELFLRYNYACYRLAKLVKAQSRRKSAARAQKMVLWQTRAMEARSMLALANMALVLAMAKRTRIPNVEFSELVSEGNMALLRSIEKFDASRGFKFSTYACRAILKSFNRLATKTGRYRQYFPTEFDPDLERSDFDENRHEMQRDDSVESLREILAQNTAKLTKTEQLVVMERFALGTDRPRGRTLAQVGEIVGLTNERVRQIQNHALRKIRSALDAQYLVA
jgi:RNA polymerase sigma factor (sigma-70 family)